jgi:hypothetical protein
MIAPVAAPHAAPWPTGVSQEFKKENSAKFLKESGEHLFSSKSHLLTNEPRADRIVARQSGHSARATT